MSGWYCSPITVRPTFLRLVTHNASLSSSELEPGNGIDPLHHVYTCISLYLMTTCWDNPVGKNAIPSGAQRADDRADTCLGAHTARPPQPNTCGGASGHGWKGNRHTAPIR